MDYVKKQYHTARWKRTQMAVIERDKGICQLCGKPVTGRFIIDHIKLATTANFYDIDNLQLLDIECHNRITFHDGKNKTDANRTTPPLQEVTNLLEFPKD